MNYKDLKSSLEEVLSTQATSHDYGDTINFLIDKCYEYGADNVEIDAHDNLYVTKGKAQVFPCVVSHTDTVHDIYKGYEVLEQKGNFFGFDNSTMKQVGVGGDDKVGMFICLQMLKKFKNIKIAFFAQEEIGCVGSSQADKKFFEDVGFALECDRKGNNDFVQTSSGVKMFDKKFKNKIMPVLKKFGYSITTGGLTDVHEIAQDMSISCANMSCGYYNPHSEHEYVSIKDAINTCRMVSKLIELLGENDYPHKAVDDYSSYGWGYTNYYGYGVSTPKVSSKPYTKKDNKVKNTSKLYDGCDVCGAISTDGCDWCYKDHQPSGKLKEKTKACTCGGEMPVHKSVHGDYYHCKDCGFYEEVKDHTHF